MKKYVYWRLLQKASLWFSLNLPSNFSETSDSLFKQVRWGLNDMKTIYGNTNTMIFLNFRIKQQVIFV